MRYLRLIMTSLAIAFVINAGGVARAQETTGDQPSLCETVGTQIVCKVESPIKATDVPSLVNTIITAALGVIGAFALLMFVWGGVTWFLSAGNPEKVKAGAQTMLWAALGVILVFASYLVLTAVLNTLSGKQ